MSRGGRMRRVDELLREVVAAEVARLKDPGLGFVTITGVRTAPDLRSARVYYSVLGDEEQQAATAGALQRAASRVRAAAGRQVRLKYTPELRFEPDSAIEQGMRIEALLREIKDGESDESGDAGGDPEGG